MPDDDLFYFAYGSNLDTLRKEERTGRIREARMARLKDYRLAFNKRASGGGVFANVVRQPGSEVWGVAYRCRPEALDQMDRYEGVPGRHYVRSQVEVEATGKDVIQAITYIAGAEFICPEGRPHTAYLRRIILGAKAHGLPSEYVAHVERIAACEGAERNHFQNGSD